MIADMIFSMTTENNMESKICTSEFMSAVYINMTQKVKTFFLSTQSQATTKISASEISSLLNRQRYCKSLLVAHKLKKEVVQLEHSNQLLSSDGTRH